MARELSRQGFAFEIPSIGPLPGTAPAALAPLQAPAGTDGFVTVDGERFVLADSGQAIRFWGTNLCFAGCFPPHEVADRMARRLASLGINCVRFHHMDMHGYPTGIWADRGSGDFHHGELHPEGLDRLDYLIAQLKEQGVYANLNLHVSRTYGAADGFPDVRDGESVPNFGKGVDHFFPKCIEEQKRYARMLLHHVNAYTGNKYAEEPAVAMVEISNEDGLIYEWSGNRLESLPAEYREELERQWNAWLRLKYASDEILREVWNEGEVRSEGKDMLESPAVTGSMQALGGAGANFQAISGPGGAEGGRIRVQQASPTTWHVQYRWGPLTVEKGTAYVLALKLRASRRCEVGVNCMMNHEPWANLGLGKSLDVGSEWQDYSVVFTATDTDGPKAGAGGARITLSGLSQEGLEVEFADVRLKRATVTGLPDGESLAGSVAWPARSELSARTQQVGLDMVAFLRDTELAYWRGMREYLQAELGVRMPVTGTAVGFTTPQMAAGTADFVDSHAYWRHPRFPGRPWDRENWIVEQDAMVNDPAGSTLKVLAGRRVLGLPYTITEYNHPAPNRYEAEGFPLIAAVGALQGWDGVFGFAYSHGTNWETDHFQSFFDISGHPTKLALTPACSALFRSRQDAEPRPALAAHTPEAHRIEALLERGPRLISAYNAGVNQLAWQRQPIAVDVGNGSEAMVRDSSGELQWKAEDEAGWTSYTAPGAAALVGFCEGQTVELSGIQVHVGELPGEGFAVVMLNTVGGGSADGAQRYLLAAVSAVWSPGMVWNEEGTSVGRQWGSGPTLCQGVPLTVNVNADAQAQVYALSPDGTRREQLSVARTTDGRGLCLLGPANRTLWYELILEDNGG